MHLQETAQELRSMLFNLKSHRANLEYEWGNTLRIVRPNRLLEDYLANQPYGGTKGFSGYQGYISAVRSLYDNRGATNSAILASYLHSSLTNPHDTWMNLSPKDAPDLREDMEEEDIRYLQDLQMLTDQSHREWQSSNLHQVLYPYYKSLVDIGNACMTSYKVSKDKKRYEEMMFGSRSMYNVYFLEDAYGKPDYVFCVYYWTARQLVEYFAKGLDPMGITRLFGDQIYQSAIKGDTTLYSYIHYVRPTYLDDNPSKAYKSCYFLYDHQSMMNSNTAPMNVKGQDPYQNTGIFKEEFIDRQPYIISRIRKTDGELYGNGYSMECLPLLIQLQLVQRSLTVGAQKNIEPSINAPTKRVDRKYSTNPNHINYMDMINGKPMQVSPTMPPVDLMGAAKIKEDLYRDIDSTFLIDKIQIESVRYNRTAQEVQKRTGEEIKILSPFIGVLEHELVDPLIRLTLNYLAKNGSQKIKNIMRRNAGNQFSIKFISDIARAQIRSTVRDLVEQWSIKMQFSQDDPIAKHLVNMKKYMYKMLLAFNTGFDTWNTPDEIAKLVKDEVEQQQLAIQAQQAGTAKDMSQSYKNVAEAEGVNAAS